MRIVVDRDRCRGAGQCVLTAPAVFDQSDDDGIVLVLQETPPRQLHAAVRAAAGLCPNTVISLIEESAPLDR